MSGTARSIGWAAYWRAQVLETARDVSAFGSPLAVAITWSVAAFVDRPLALRLAVGFACVELSANAIKFLLPRDRPVRQPHHDVLSRLDAASFPSLHTARVAMILAAGDPSAGWILPWAAATVGVAWSRVALKRHFPGDVLAGCLLGLLLGWLTHGLVPCP